MSMGVQERKFNFVKKHVHMISHLRKRKIVQQRYNVLANVFLC